MKFDYCIGNPPYNSGEYQNNTPLWPKLIFEMSTLINKMCMVHPARWVHISGIYKRIFENMCISGLKEFKYYPNSADIFPNIALDGGVSITYFENQYSGPINYKLNDVPKGEFHSENRLFRSQFLEEAFNKVFTNYSDLNTMNKRIRADLNTNGTHSYAYIKDRNLNLLQETPKDLFKPVKVWISKTQGRGESKFMWYYIDKENLLNIDDYLYSSKKVAIDGRGHSLVHGKGNGFNNLPQICDRNQIAFGNILVFPEYEKERDLALIKSLMTTKTARYLMSITQTGLSVCGFENIPDYIELAKLLPDDELFTDEWFYKTFNFSQELINDIETRVSEKKEK